MELKDWLMLIGGIVLLILSVFTVIFTVRDAKRLKKLRAMADADNDSARQGEALEISSTVKALIEAECAIIFEDGEGIEHKIAVKEEYFSEFKVGQTGLLTIMDGEFYNFVLDE